MLSHKRSNVIETTNSEVGHAAVLHDHKNTIMILILGLVVRLEHLLVGNGAEETQNTVGGVFE